MYWMVRRAARDRDRDDSASGSPFSSSSRPRLSIVRKPT
jgi:hypothetical protein